MEFGFNVPVRGALADTQSLKALAIAGEEKGFTHLAIPDHIVIPRDIESRYPYTQTGQFPGGSAGNCFEQLTTMAFLAGVTSTARLLTSVMVVPHRGAVHTAKTLATIDQFSGGRVTVGVGAGWMEEEFVAINAPDFKARGKVTNEFLEVFKDCWTNDNPKYDGEFASYSDIEFAPQPVQNPHPPIWVGGESNPAMRRAVKYADAWYPIGANPRFPLNTPALYNGALDRLKEMCEKGDRDPATLETNYWANWYNENNPVVKLDSGERHMFTGTAADIVDDIGAMKEAGVAKLLFSFQRDTLAESLDSMDFFIEEIRSKL